MTTPPREPIFQTAPAGAATPGGASPTLESWADLPPLPRIPGAPDLALDPGRDRAKAAAAARGETGAPGAKTGSAATSDPDSDLASDPDDDTAEVTRKELFARVKARTEGVPGREIRKVMEMLLVELGAAIAAGETLKLPGLGTLRVQQHKDLGDADLMLCRVRRKKPGAGPKDPLAKLAEDG